MPDSVTPWTVACQAPLSMGFSGQEYWNGPSFPSPGNLPNPRVEPTSPVLAGRFLTPEPPGKSFYKYVCLVTQFCLTLCDRAHLKGLITRGNYIRNFKYTLRTDRQLWPSGIRQNRSYKESFRQRSL